MDPQQAQMVPVKETVVRQFGLGPVEPVDGGLMVTFVHGDGEVVRYPISQAAAEELGKKLLAPRVETARVVPAGNGQPDLKSV